MNIFHFSSVGAWKPYHHRPLAEFTEMLWRILRESFMVKLVDVETFVKQTSDEQLTVCVCT